MSFLCKHGSRWSNLYSEKKTIVYFIIKIANVLEALKFLADKSKNKISLDNICRDVDDFINFYSQATETKIGSSSLYSNPKLIEKVFAQNTNISSINIPKDAVVMKLHYRIHKNTKTTDLKLIIKHGALIEADLPGNIKLSVTGETIADYGQIKNFFGNCVTYNFYRVEGIKK
jgi:hypothetical protein